VQRFLISQDTLRFIVEPVRVPAQISKAISDMRP
jgi:hypothetical protein